jgi:hypothetical protein
MLTLLSQPKKQHCQQDRKNPLSKNKMKIRVTEVRSIKNTIHVNFLSSAGSGTGAWIGIQPIAGKELDVEFDLDELFSWGRKPHSITSQITTYRHHQWRDPYNG